jgi:hypothetical protein
MPDVSGERSLEGAETIAAFVQGTAAVIRFP